MAKQKEVKEDFDFGNIVGVKNKKILSKSKKEQKTEKVALNFKIHKKVIFDFFNLKQEYAFSKQEYNLSTNKSMMIMINFLYDLYKEMNILETAPEDFSKAILRKGKRRRNNRSYKKEDCDLFQIFIFEEESQKYINVMYSFIRNDKNSNEFEEHHTRAYFFYDFIDQIKKYKDKFLEY